MCLCCMVTFVYVCQENMEQSVLNFAQYIYNKGFVDNIKLNKLLYISFGFYGAGTKEYLFDDVIEAWDYGPVVPAVYYAYKNGFFSSTNQVQLNEQSQKTIDRVLSLYGEKAPFLLVELTHQFNTPWSNVYVAGQKNTEIPKSDIIDYYSRFLSTVNKVTKSINTPAFQKVLSELSTM